MQVASAAGGDSASSTYAAHTTIEAHKLPKSLIASWGKVHSLLTSVEYIDSYSYCSVGISLWVSVTLLPTICLYLLHMRRTPTWHSLWRYMIITYHETVNIIISGSWQPLTGELLVKAGSIMAPAPLLLLPLTLKLSKKLESWKKWKPIPILEICDLLRTSGYFLMYPLVSTVVLFSCYSIYESSF